MIDPNMATMLCFLIPSAAIGRKDLAKPSPSPSSNPSTASLIDGDMSTNDTVVLLANGAAHEPSP